MSDSEISNKDIVLFALYEMGGVTTPIHTEDVAHQVFQYPLGRQRYQWEKYGIYPDKERVARELRRLKQWNGSEYVKGHVNIGARTDRIDGWLITAVGVDYITAKKDQLISSLNENKSTRSVYNIEELRKRILSSSCYKAYLKDPEVSKTEDHHFTDLLYCLPDAPKEKIHAAFDELLASTKTVEEVDLVDFLNVVRSRYNHLF